jgi:hypothetical protein
MNAHSMTGVNPLNRRGDARQLPSLETVASAPVRAPRADVRQAYRHREDDPLYQRFLAALILPARARFDVLRGQLGNQLHWWGPDPFPCSGVRTPRTIAQLKRTTAAAGSATQRNAMTFVKVTQPSDETPRN